MTEKTSWAVAADITEANINTYMRHTGGAWNADTGATIEQGGAITTVIQQAIWYRSGRLIVGDYRLLVNSTGVASALVLVKLPVDRVASLPAGMPVGRGLLFDSSAGTYYPCLLTTRASTNSLCELRGIGPTGATGARLGLAPSNFTAALAVNDVMRFTFCYEAGAS